MKRSAIAATALLALVALGGCSSYDFQYFVLEKVRVEAQPDGTWVYIRPLPSRFVDEERQLIRERDPYRMHFAIWGRFEAIETIEAWFVLNGERIPFPLDRDGMAAARDTSTSGEMFIFPSAPDYILETPWEEIESLELHTVFTATMDGETKRYHIVTPFEKKYEERTGNPIWDAMMSV